MMFGFRGGSDLPWQIAALLPVLALGAYWAVGEVAMIGGSMVLSVLLPKRHAGG